VIWRLKAALREALSALKSKDYAIAEIDILEALNILEEMEEHFEPRKPWCWP